MFPQGDGLCASLKCLEDRLESDLSTDPLASLVEQANRNLHLVNNRVVQLEAMFQTDLAAGAKRYHIASASVFPRYISDRLIFQAITSVQVRVL